MEVVNVNKRSMLKHITNLEIGISRLQDRVAAIQAKIDMAPKEVADASKDLYFTNGEIDAAKLRS